MSLWSIQNDSRALRLRFTILSKALNAVVLGLFNSLDTRRNRLRQDTEMIKITTAVAVIGVLLFTGLAMTIVHANGVTESKTFDASGWFAVTGLDQKHRSSFAWFGHDESGISSVTVVATKQRIEGTLSSLEICGSGSCGALGQNKVIAINSYNLRIASPEVGSIRYSVPNRNGDPREIAELISGKFIGSVNGAFVVGDGQGKTAGHVGLRIEGDATFACFAPTAGPLDPCIEGEGTLLPVNLDFIGSGRYAIDVTEHAGADPGSRVYELGTLNLDMILQVDLSNHAHGRGNAVSASGSLSVIDVTTSYE